MYRTNHKYIFLFTNPIIFYYFPNISNTYSNLITNTYTLYHLYLYRQNSIYTLLNG